MRRILKLTALLLIGVIIFCGYSYLTDKTNYAKWNISKLNSDTTGVSWAKFIWTNDTLNGKYYERTSMQIPCKIEGLPYSFLFQFDLGADLTSVYENNISSFYTLYPDLKNRIARLRSPLQFWYNKKGFKDLTILFGGYEVSNKFINFYSNYGSKLNIEKSSLSDTFNIGTIGVDLFQNKVLIIDYPNQRFAISDTVPRVFNFYLSDIELDQAGRVLLPMQLKGKKFNTMFDNGSSLFPLLVTDDKINNFSNLPNCDTFIGNAWGKTITMIGRPLNDSFIIAGHTFNKSKVYADYRQDSRTNKYDAVTGNILFWDKTIIMDFKNKKFGIGY